MKVIVVAGLLSMLEELRQAAYLILEGRTAADNYASVQIQSDMQQHQQQP